MFNAPKIPQVVTIQDCTVVPGRVPEFSTNTRPELSAGISTKCGYLRVTRPSTTTERFHTYCTSNTSMTHSLVFMECMLCNKIQNKECVFMAFYLCKKTKNTNSVCVAECWLLAYAYSLSLLYIPNMISLRLH